MSGLQEEYLQHQTKIEQLRLSIQYIRWYLVSLILLCLISAIIFFCYFTSYITNFIWSIGFTILTLTCLLFVPKLLTHYRDIISLRNRFNATRHLFDVWNFNGN